MITTENLRTEALALATRMCDLTALLASPDFRGAVNMEAGARPVPMSLAEIERQLPDLTWV